MPEVILNCPQCQRQLRVTDELIGRPVKCPACGLMFTIPVGSTEPQFEPAPVVQEASPGQAPGLPGRYEGAEPIPRTGLLDFERAYPRRAGGLVLAPAIILLILTILSLLGELIFIIFISLNPEQLMQQAQQQVQAMEKAMNVKLGPMPSPAVLIGYHAFFAVICLIIIVACIQMMRLRMYPLAIVGSVLPMINCGVYCCIPSLPFCIWAFIVLIRSDVRNAFH